MTDQELGFRLTVIFLMFCGSVVYSQETVPVDYEEFRILESQEFSHNNFRNLRKLIKAHASKAKQQKDTIELANAFYYRVLIEDEDLALVYADSILLLTQNSQHFYYPTVGFILRGNLYYRAGHFQNALNDYLKAYKLAVEKNNEGHQREISNAIAAVRNVNGQHTIAVDLYNHSLQLLRKKDDYKILNYEEYVLLLHNLALTHLRISQLDSARFYLSDGMKVAQSSGNNIDFRDFVLVGAQIDYYEGNYNKPNDTLIKYINQFQGTSKAIKYYYLAKISQTQNKDKTALEYFKKVDSIVMRTGDPFEELKDVYQHLIIHTNKNKDLEGQIEYLDKLVFFDSLLSSQRQIISNKSLIAFDIPFLKHQKKKAEELLKVRSTALNGIGILAFIAISYGGFLFYNSRIMKKRLKLLLEDKVDRNITSTSSTQNPPSSVPAEIVKDILEKLEHFERNQRFLRKDIDMTSMSQELGTNTSYLSVIINHYKKVSFPQYLKDLKINLAVQRLKEDPQLLKFNYQGLADTFGFKSASSFSKAFFERTGVYPSKFLDKLNIEKQKSHL